ncbi:MAG: hypothetical protein AABW51_04535 [Nanoarchaeota archaeon]
MLNIDEQVSVKRTEWKNIASLIIGSSKYVGRERREHEEKIKQARRDYYLKYHEFFDLSKRPGEIAT